MSENGIKLSLYLIHIFYLELKNPNIFLGDDEKRFEHLKEYIEEENKWNIFAKFNIQHEQVMLIKLPNYMNSYDFNW